MSYNSDRDRGRCVLGDYNTRQRDKSHVSVVVHDNRDDSHRQHGVTLHRIHGKCTRAFFTETFDLGEAKWPRAPRVTSCGYIHPSKRSTRFR